LALIKYVDTGYAVIDYFLEWDDSVYLEPDYVAPGYVGNIVTADAVLTAVTAQVSTPQRQRQFASAVTVSTEITATSNKIKSAGVTASSAAIVESSAIRTFSLDSSLNNDTTISAQSNVLFDASSDRTLVAMLVAVPNRVRPADSVFEAFNTTVVVATTQKLGQSALTVTTASSVRANYLIAGATVVTTSASPTGIRFDSDNQPLLRPLWQPTGSAVRPTSVSFEAGGTTSTVAHWLRVDGQGCLWSSAGGDLTSALTYYVGFYKVSDGFEWRSVVWQMGFGPVATQTLKWTTSHDVTQWHHYILDFASGTSNRLFVNGVSQGAPTVTGTGSTLTGLANPIYFGAQVVATTDVSSNRGFTFTLGAAGEVAQFWAGQPGSLAWNDLELDPPTENFIPGGGYWNLTANQTSWFSPRGFDGYNRTFSSVIFYSELDYPYIDRIPGGDSTVAPGYNSSQPAVEYRDPTVNFQIGNGGFAPIYDPEFVTPDSWIPTVTLNSFMNKNVGGVFTVYAEGIVPTLGSAGLEVISSVATIGGRLTSAQANITANFSVVSQGNYTQKGEVELSATATVTPTALRIQPGQSNLTASVTIATDGGVIQPAGSNITAEFIVTAIGFDQNQGESLLAFNTTLTAEAYDFTKATADLDTAFNTEITATALVPTKGFSQITSTVDIQVDAVVIRAAITQLAAEFAASATQLTIRPGLANLTATASITAQQYEFTKAQSALQAFNTVLSAGRQLDLIDENIIRVAIESRQLLAQDLQATILAVQSAQGVNTVMAEPRTIEVETETRTLLSQFN
jgi:hypothetical protein